MVPTPVNRATELEDRYRAAEAALSVRNQGHVLRWWAELDQSQRERLLGQIESIPWSIVDPVIPTHVLSAPRREIKGQLEPAPVLSRTPDAGQLGLYRKAEKAGVKLLESGAVAAFTVAGGQATRLGVSVPKGTVTVTPVGDKSLFEIFAATVAAARARFGAAIPWYVMTSQGNHEATLAYFREHVFFGLPPGDVILFPQGMLPVFSMDGKLLLESKDSLALAPDGHGGALKALASSGALDDMKKRGVRSISYFQVDNPLAKPFDALFLGLHKETGSEMSTKVARKSDDLERVGNVCLLDGKVTVIEYSEFPEELARAKNPDGSRRFDAANLAIHALDVEFVRRIAGQSASMVSGSAGPTAASTAALQLPLRRAEKTVPYIDDSGRRVVPERPNAVKLETFVFDALPLAKNPLLLEADRAEEFSPVKNASGPDSLETSMRDQIARAVRWLSSAGVSVPRNSSGDPDLTVAISPRFALDPAELKEKAHLVPQLRPGDRVYIE